MLSMCGEEGSPGHLCVALRIWGEDHDGGPQGSLTAQPTGLNFTSWHPNTFFFLIAFEEQEV